MLLEDPNFKLNTEVAFEYLMSPDALPCTVLLLLSTAYKGVDFLEEDSQEVFLTVKETYGGLSLETENKINALVTLLTTDLFFHDVEVFESITLALTQGDIGTPGDRLTDEKPSMVDIVQVLRLTEILELSEDFSDEIKNYMDDIFKNEAIDFDDDDMDASAILEEIADIEGENHLAKAVTLFNMESLKQLIALGVPADIASDLLLTEE